jgi:hypothetical protein
MQMQKGISEKVQQCLKMFSMSFNNHKQVTLWESLVNKTFLSKDLIKHANKVLM